MVELRVEFLHGHTLLHSAARSPGVTLAGSFAALLQHRVFSFNQRQCLQVFRPKTRPHLLSCFPGISTC